MLRRRWRGAAGGADVGGQQLAERLRQHRGRARRDFDRSPEGGGEGGGIDALRIASKRTTRDGSTSSPCMASWMSARRISRASASSGLRGIHGGGLAINELSLMKDGEHPAAEFLPHGERIAGERDRRGRRYRSPWVRGAACRHRRERAGKRETKAVFSASRAMTNTSVSWPAIGSGRSPSRSAWSAARSGNSASSSLVTRIGTAVMDFTGKQQRQIAGRDAGEIAGALDAGGGVEGEAGRRPGRSRFPSRIRRGREARCSVVLLTG